MESITCFKLVGNRTLSTILIVSLLLAVTSVSHADSLKSLGWKVKTFAGPTHYTIDFSGNESTIRGETRGGAAALYKKKKINIRNTPVMRWQWKVNNTYQGINEKAKNYAAGIVQESDLFKVADEQKEDLIEMLSVAASSAGWKILVKEQGIKD